jgi:protein-tyrosine phosphatase
MIDIHSHILFGVDDGAKTIEDSVNIIKEEISKGVTHIILTPHFKNKYIDIKLENIEQNYNALKEYILKNNMDINIYMGNEIFFDSNYYEILEEGDFYSLANSKYILIEFDVSDIPKNIAEMCYDARIKGFIPIIAHVERYSTLYKDMDLLKEILNEGALLQVNASTVANKEDRESHRFANYLLKHELVSFIASDIHNLRSRGFHLDEAFKAVKKSCGNVYANKIFRENQLKVIANEYFEIPHIKSNGGKILSKLFKINKI